MNFLENIFEQLQAAQDTTLLVRNGSRGTVEVTGQGLLELVGSARAFLASKGLKKGDRCALLSQNSIRWIAMNLAIMAEGLIAVPLYARQAPGELVAMMKDCSPALLCCGTPELRQGILETWPDAPENYLLEAIFSTGQKIFSKPTLAAEAPVTIIYTSGTSGEAKGVVLTAGNVEFMLQCTSARLDLLMKGVLRQNQVFHYLPFCFAGSWIMMLTCLMRRSRLTINSDLNQLSGEMRDASADYFLNVPALLERIRKGVDEQLRKTGGIVHKAYENAKNAWARRQNGRATLSDKFWLSIANLLIFPAIRKKMIGRQLKALICGSAPLLVETQVYFKMLGIAVLQGYGLTETTALCTLDHPNHVEYGRVGPAIEGVEMKLSENEEILVRGPNVFSGYWNRPEETAKVLRDGWFYSGDQGEINAAGNWRIIGRIKNLVILGSGHNIAPEPIEDKVFQHLPKAQQVVLVGNGRGYLSAIVTGDLQSNQVQTALDTVNAELPHYKQIRAFHIVRDPFSIDNGLLTANGKLKRAAIAAQLHAEIEGMYQVKQAG